MFNYRLEPPTLIEASVYGRLPDALRLPRPSAWAEANKPGHVIDCFLEGPVFDAQGRLYVTDIPHGRIFRVDAGGDWTQVAETGGWPNGLAVHADGSLWVADYRHGILRCDPATGAVETVLGHRNSESFRGVNDLVFDRDGNLYFTDQGQTGMHDPTGRVYRLRTDGRLDLLLANAPSPNGVAISADGKVLFVAVTRGNQVWRAPLQRDGSITKMGAFQTFYGASGPDGLAATDAGGVLVAHASLGAVFVLDAHGSITHVVKCPDGCGPTLTNLTFQPGMRRVVITDSSTGTLLQAELPCGPAPAYHLGGA